MPTSHKLSFPFKFPYKILYAFIIYSMLNKYLAYTPIILHQITLTTSGEEKYKLRRLSFGNV